MTIEQIIILSLIQGITEFLPISSSGHLAMLPLITNWQDKGVMSDVALHFGSLMAVIIYFWRDVKKIFSGFLDIFRRQNSQNRTLFLLISLSTIPVFVVGYILKSTGIVNDLRSLEVIAWANIIFAVFLYIFDKIGSQTKDLQDFSVKDAVMIGIAQCFALIPGSSRSGTTITMARKLGYKRDESARLSMLMGIPIILGASLLLLLDLSQESDVSVQLDAVIMAGLSFVVALVAIWGLMAMLKRVSMLPFVVYRLVLGLVLIAYIYM